MSNPKSNIEAPAFAEAASRRQAKQILNSNLKTFPGLGFGVLSFVIVSDFVLLISNLMVKGGGLENLLYIIGDGKDRPGMWPMLQKSFTSAGGTSRIRA